MRFTLFGWHVSLRAYRARRYTREELEARGAIVCGPDIEQQMVDDADREDHDLQVLCDLHTLVSDDMDGAIADLYTVRETLAHAVITDPTRFTQIQTHVAEYRLLNYLRDLRDIAGRIGEVDLAPAASGAERAAEG